MIDILLFYATMASTFTLAKTVVFYLAPFFFLGFRMVLAGTILLGYLFFFKRSLLKIEKAHGNLFLQIIAFHICGAYLLEFWAIQYTASAKACLFYNTAPFFTALLSFYLFNERLLVKQWGALMLGFLGMIPVMIGCSNTELSLASCSISLPEIVLLFSVAFSAYGWILMKQLVDKRYSPILVNGIGMFFGGVIALIASVFFESNPIRFDILDQSAWIMVTFCLISLIILANIIGYNWYGFLLKQYSATFLSLVGISTPLFAGLYGWIFLDEKIGGAFLLATTLTGVAIYLFYRPSNKKK